MINLKIDSCVSRRNQNYVIKLMSCTLTLVKSALRSTNTLEKLTETFTLVTKSTETEET